MGYLKYKGYTGSVEYSEEDKCLFGKVLGMEKDHITYEGTTVEELTMDFQGAIDDYLQLCVENSIEPRKPYTGVLNVRLTPEIHSGAAMAANKAGISINAFIKNAVAKALGMTVIAEGVETKEQLGYLKSVECDQLQGYYFSKPLTEDDFIKLMKKS